MADSPFQRNLHAYSEWKLRLGRTIQEYKAWLGAHGLTNPETQQRIGQALDTLHADRLTIAFVAEFSRGKTELINSIFFADYGRRLLPSTAGRTTMCPTEVLWDEQCGEAYLQLLPIETRNQDRTIAEYKKDFRQWVHYPLDVDSPEQMENTLRELSQTKRVSIGEASRLGLYNQLLRDDGNIQDDRLEIPRWRHAVISFPHPLLKQGLVILDTPGLNALGSEPELTLSTLPNAQAVLFVLAADTGVTRSDLDMWQHHIKGFQNARQRGLIVVLNKIDTLWDDLRDEAETLRVIARQKASTAQILGVAEPAIFPVSAHKALLGKVRNDKGLLERSAIGELESYLAEDMLAARQQIVLDNIEAEVGELIESNRGLVAQQLNNIKHQLNELEDLRDKSEDVIEHLLEKTRGEQAHYLDSVSRFQTSRAELQEKIQELREMLDLAKIERLMEQTHRAMLHSWTTRGMKQGMKFLFDELRRSMQAITSHAERTRKIVRGIYQRFQNEFALGAVQPYKFSTMKYRVELELLFQEAEAFRKSPSLAVVEQSFVVKRFYQIMVGRAHRIFLELSKSLYGWMAHALDPLVSQIHEHKEMMEKRLGNLQKISQSKNTLQARITDLEGQYAELARQLTALRNLYNGIHLSRPLSADSPPKPRLVQGQGA